MNSKRMTTLLALLAAVAGPLAGDALARPGQGAQDCAQWEERGPQRKLERMAVLLELSPAQKSEAEALVSAHRDATQALHEQVDQGRDAVHQAALAVPFDETRVRTLAAAQAKLQTELMVSRAKLRSQLQALLTPEQQARAAALKLQLGGGRGAHPRGF
jgi:Spy/CpxP family protein refolding chaperone